MTTVYEKNRTIEDKFSKVIKTILGNQFFVKDIQMDLKNGTDFLTFMAKNQIKVAVRLRRYSYLEKYPEDFTIRWKLRSGVKTEIHKIMEGLVDYLLYGFINEEETKIIKYFIGDLSVFRKCNMKPVAVIPNDPPDSKLAVYKISQFPKNFILKTWLKN